MASKEASSGERKKDLLSEQYWRKSLTWVVVTNLNWVLNCARWPYCVFLKKVCFSSLKWLAFLPFSFLLHLHCQLRTSPRTLPKIKRNQKLYQTGAPPLPTIKLPPVWPTLSSSALLSSECLPRPLKGQSLLLGLGAHPRHLFREFFFYSLFSTAVSLPPESFPSATDQCDLASSIFNFPPYFAPFLWFLLELQYSEELIYAHYLHFLICIHSSI